MHKDPEGNKVRVKLNKGEYILNGCIIKNVKTPEEIRRK
jgi:hypothetical protein